MDAALIAAGRRLVVIGRAGVGVDNVDLDAATRAGIVVVNAPTGNTIAAAEHTLALLYALARHIAGGRRLAAARRVEAQPVHRRRAARQDARHRRARQDRPGDRRPGAGDGDDRLGRDPYVSAEQAALHGVELVDLDTLLARSDVITVHVPLTRTDARDDRCRELGPMKAGAFVLNVARGGIIDEAALAEALQAGKIGGAGIDVYDQEPPTDSPLLDAPNTILTPHLGASTAEAQVRVAEEVAVQIVDVLDGRPARYAVNAPLLTPETAQAIAPYLPLAETARPVLRPVLPGRRSRR